MKRRSASRPTPVRPTRTWHLPRPWTRSVNSGRLILRWRTLLTYLVVLGGLSWAAATTGLYYFIKHRSGFTEVRYAHVVGLPWTLQAYRHAKGEFWLAQGLTDAEEGRWRDAFDRLRQGLPFAPENEEARLMLARIYLMAGRPDMARIVLVEGLEHRADQSEYLRTVIGFLFGQQADEAVAELAKGLLDQGGLDKSTRRLVGVSRIYALFNRDRFAELPAALRELELERSIEGRFIEARIAWETGAQETAVLMLRDLHARAAQDPEIYRTLVFYLRELKRPDEARRVALARHWAMPGNAEAQVDYIALSEGETRREAETAFFTEFKDKPEALLKLATWAAKEGEADLAWRVATLCPPKSAAAGGATLLWLEAELKRGGYRAALDGVAQAQASGIPWNLSQQIALVGVQAVAQSGLGLASEAQGNINRVVASPVMAASNHAVMAVHLQRLGDKDNAGRLLRRALELEPLNQPALVALLRLELEQGALDTSLAWVRRLPEVRKPPADLMQAIMQNLESDRYLFLTERQAAIQALQSRLDAVQPRSSS